MTKVSLTHLDKIFWPKEGFTKGDVIRYYDRVADVILPYLRHRPMVLNRHPNGIRGDELLSEKRRSPTSAAFRQDDHRPRKKHPP